MPAVICWLFVLLTFNLYLAVYDLIISNNKINIRFLKNSMSVLDSVLRALSLMSICWCSLKIWVVFWMSWGAGWSWCQSLLWETQSRASETTASSPRNFTQACQILVSANKCYRLIDLHCNYRYMRFSSDVLSFTVYCIFSLNSRTQRLSFIVYCIICFLGFQELMSFHFHLLHLFQNYRNICHFLAVFCFIFQLL